MRDTPPWMYLLEVSFRSPAPRKGRAGRPVPIVAVDPSFLTLNRKGNLPVWFPEKRTIALTEMGMFLISRWGLGEADGFKLDIRFEIV